MRYKDMIKIPGLVKSVAFVMWCLCGAFSQKSLDQAKKKTNVTMQGSTKSKWPYFGTKIEI